MRELQSLLRQRQLFAGRSTATTARRSAIEAYEKAEGLTVTGLATMALLQRLGGAWRWTAEGAKRPARR